MSRETGGPSPKEMGVETAAGRPNDADFEERVENYTMLLPKMKAHYDEMKQNLEELSRGGGDPSLSPGWTAEDFQELLRRVNESEKTK